MALLFYSVVVKILLPSCSLSVGFEFVSFFLVVNKSFSPFFALIRAKLCSVASAVLLFAKDFLPQKNDTSDRYWLDVRKVNFDFQNIHMNLAIGLGL